MMKPIKSLGIAFLVLFCATTAGARERLSLDGTWNFALDKDGAGEQARLFDPAVPLESKIEVPGAWDAQGFGTETSKVRHQSIGKGWYRKAVRIPEAWRGKRLYLTIGGIHRYAKVWVNNVLLGEHVGYLSPFEYDITEHVTAGQAATIAICVDSNQRWDVDCLTGCFDIIDAMFIAWGGIWGHVALETRSPTWLEDLFVQPKIDPPACLVSAKLAGEKVAGAAVKLEVLDAKGKVAAAATLDLQKALTATGELNVQAEIPDARLWSPNHPYLYTARLSLLRGNEPVDSIETRFGLRQIEIRGPHFYLNGKKTFLHGYGDDAIYPETMAAPSDKAVYVKRLRVAREYGFNYVRHHSHFLPPEYYEAADEVGVLVSPELPIAYMSFYNRAKGAALDLYKTEWAATIRRLRNHPSVLDWCMGNEMWNGIGIGPDLYRMAKGLDPSRPVIDTDGLVSRGWLDGSRDRDTLDFYVVALGEHNLPLDQPAKHRFEEPKKPVISHETGNFVTFPRLDLIERFKDNFKPFWLTPVRQKLESLGLLGEAERWAENSEKLYLLCHKLNTEDIRKNPYLSGHQWWLLQDYWTGSNGIVDAYFRPKKEIPPDEVRMFNSDTVLLLDGLRTTYRGNQPLNLRLLVSNYSEDDLADATLKWRVELEMGGVIKGEQEGIAVRQGELVVIGLGGSVITEGEQKGVKVGQGEVACLKVIDVALPAAMAWPQRLTVEAELSGGSATFRNSWSAWVYPETIRPPRPSVPIFASSDLLKSLAGWGAEALPEAKELPARAVYVMSQPTPEAVRAMAEGACLVLISPRDVFPAVSNRFKTAWWLGSAKDSNAGTVVYTYHPVTHAVAPDGWCDVGWYHLLEGSRAYVLDDLPARPDVLIRAIDVHALCRNKALLFEASVGKGSLVVSGLNLSLGTEPPLPEREWILARLLVYAGTLPRPSAELPLEFISKRVAEGK